MPVVMHVYRTKTGRPARQSCVYFIKSGDYIKIGWTRGSLSSRLCQIQSSNPNQVHLLCAIEGDASTEAQWHLRFHEHWVRGEWFRLKPEVYREIARLAHSDEALVVDQHRTSGTLTRQDPKWRNAKMERIARKLRPVTGKSPLAAQAE